jgi:thiamine kinase-like enzyme
MGSEDNDRERVRDIIKRLLNRAVNAQIIKEKPNLYYDAAHQIERLFSDNERLERLILELKQENERLRQSYIPFMEKHNELRDAVKQLFRDRTFATFEQNLSWLKRYIEQ